MTGDVAICGFCFIVFVIIALPTFLMGCDPKLMPLCPAYKTTQGYINGFTNYDAGGNSDACSKNFYLGFAQVQLQDGSACRFYVIQATCDPVSATQSAVNQFGSGLYSNTTVYIPKVQDPYHPSICYQTGTYTKQLATIGISFFVLAAVCVCCAIGSTVGIMDVPAPARGNAPATTAPAAAAVPAEARAEAVGVDEDQQFTLNV